MSEGLSREIRFSNIINHEFFRFKNIRKECKSEFERYWKCLDMNNQMFMYCREEEEPFTKCTLTKLVLWKFWYSGTNHLHLFHFRDWKTNFGREEDRKTVSRILMIYLRKILSHTNYTFSSTKEHEKKWISLINTFYYIKKNVFMSWIEFRN